MVFDLISNPRLKKSVLVRYNESLVDITFYLAIILNILSVASNDHGGGKKVLSALLITGVIHLALAAFRFVSYCASYAPMELYRFYKSNNTSQAHAPETAALSLMNPQLIAASAKPKKTGEGDDDKNKTDSSADSDITDLTNLSYSSLNQTQRFTFFISFASSSLTLYQFFYVIASFLALGYPVAYAYHLFGNYCSLFLQTKQTNEL